MQAPGKSCGYRERAIERLPNRIRQIGDLSATARILLQLPGGCGKCLKTIKKRRLRGSLKEHNGYPGTSAPRGVKASKEDQKN